MSLDGVLRSFFFGFGGFVLSEPVELVESDELVGGCRLFPNSLAATSLNVGFFISNCGVVIDIDESEDILDLLELDDVSDGYVFGCLSLAL